MLKISILLYFVGFSVGSSVGSSVLVVFPVPERSHGVLGDILVRTLLSVGHEVTYVTPFPKEELPNLEYVAVSSVIDGSDKISLADIDKDLVMETFGTKVSQQTLKHLNMQALMMNDTVHFDVIVAQWYYTGLLAPLSSVFECPLIWYTHNDVTWQSLSLVHASFPTTAADLSIKDRIYEMASQLHLAYRNYYHFSSTEMSAYEDSYKPIFESKRIFLPNYEFLVYNASFLLINSHPLFGEEWSLPPNAKYIGGYHLSERVPQLPKNLKKLLDESDEGTVYVDLETKIIKQEEHQNIIQELIEVFSRIKQSVILKYDEMLLNLPKNVHIMRNPPVQSILNHPNILAFISHGDTTHFLPSIHHATPTIVIPIIKEQETLVQKMTKIGLAIRVDVKELWKVNSAVKMIVGNVSYKENLNLASSIYRHRISSPKEELCHWIQAATLRSVKLLRHSPRSSVIERYNIDILVLILLFIWFCTKIVKLFNAHLYSDEDLDKKDD